MSRTRISQLRLTALGAFALALIAAGMGIYSIANGPDFDIEMIRPIPSKLSPEFLDEALNFFPHWPAWYHSGASLTQVNEHGAPIPKAQQKLRTDDYLRLGIDTKRLHGKYDVTLKVLEYTPRKRLALRVIADTKNKLTQLFEPLDWIIEFEPRAAGTLIVGKAIAHTHHWRARVFGKLVPKILLNQVYYPNLMVLAEINNPNVVYPDPDEHGPM